MLLPDDKGQLLPYGYTQADFLADVLERVPETMDSALLVPLDPDWVEPESGVHTIMPALADVIRRATPREDFDTLRRTFDLINEVIERADADPEIENAAQISFLNPPDATLLRDWGVWRLASPKLKRYIKGDYF